MNSLINRNDFAAAIKRRLASLNLPIAGEETAAAVGVHRVTLWRVMNGRGCKSETYFRICDWLGCPPERYMNREVLKASGNALENIKEIIHADQNLSVEDRTRLWHLFEAMYGSLVK